MILVDAHEDLAWNILTFGRDYTLPAVETRRREAGGETPRYNGDALLGWPDYQRGQVALVFSTLFAAPARSREGPWDTQFYLDANHARILYRAQLDVYHRLVDDHPDKFRLVAFQKDLEAVLAEWDKEFPIQEPREELQKEERSAARRRNGRAEIQPELAGRPVGLVILMEGAEGVREPEELEEWYGWGVRLIGPAWAGNRFSGGTREPGPLTSEGHRLLEKMADFGFILDLSHMDEQAALQAVDRYPGSLAATHSNALALLKGVDTNRHLSDRLIAGIVEREGVIGIVPFNKFLKPGWTTGSRREEVTLQHVFAQIDHVCQIAGDARHAGLGTDFDGGFGLQSIPAGMDTIADLQKLAPLLFEHGYQAEDIAAIFSGNWIQLLRRTLP
jgi:membrane dipeptidase